MVDLYTGFPKSLGHILIQLTSKTTVHDRKFETFLERKKLGNYFHTKFDSIWDTSVHLYKLKHTHCQALFTSWSPDVQSHYNC